MFLRESQIKRRICRMGTQKDVEKYRISSDVGELDPTLVNGDDTESCGQKLRFPFAVKAVRRPLSKSKLAAGLRNVLVGS